MTMRTLTFLVTCALMTPIANAQSPASAAKSGDRGCDGQNVLTPAEKAAGWTLLFDGTSKTGWHGYNKQDTRSWVIDDCALKTSGTETNYGSDLRPDLVTDAEYTNFELALEWKATRGGNSGIMYGVIEDPKYQAAWMTGPEYQLMDDVGFQQKLEPNRQAGANYSMHAPDESQKVLRPVGEWNTTRIVVNDAHVEHWLNGKKIVTFERWTPEWNALRDSGKWKDAPDYGKAKTGRIALQDHGSVFWFRNVKIRTAGRT
jgi:3-keto-disaccharide hydrolase